jgi:hypothetical protein
MHARSPGLLQLCCARALIFGPMFAAAAIAPAAAADVTAEPPSDLSVTVYRAPSRAPGSIDLKDLNGFALVSETRTVRLPAGESRLRFEGVADGIEPASAIVTGLPGGIIEKNRDASLLSPAALIAAALGKPVELVRSNRKTGKTERLPGSILSDAGGVVFQTSQGIEALRCSGLPETFSFSAPGDLSARPTLSVLVRSAHAEVRQVTLSYLARGFDWAADYTATLSADGRTLDLGAWVTLANANSVGLPEAHAQVVAGRVNHEDGEVEPIDLGGPILAQCWPRGSTSDAPVLLRTSRDEFRKLALAAPMTAGVQEGIVYAGAKRVTEEQLGDLKLYRVPERTTVASLQSKQVRLLDKSGVPITIVYGADLAANETAPWAPADKLLRTMNTTANHLGLPLPSGNVAVFARHEAQALLEHESGIRDIAVGEELEINMGESSDVQVSLTREKTGIDLAHAVTLPLVPGVSIRSVKVEDVSRVEISNARATAIDFELRLQIPQGGQVVRADHPLGTKNGRPMFKLKIPANGTATVRYQTQQIADRVTPGR